MFRDGALHPGVLLIDDLGNVAEETALLRKILEEHGNDLARGAFLRAMRAECELQSVAIVSNDEKLSALEARRVW